MASHAPSHSAETSGFLDGLDQKLGELANAVGSCVFKKPLAALMGENLWPDHHHHDSNPNAVRLEEQLCVNELAREIVCELLPCEPHLLPSDTPFHNLQLISLARTLKAAAKKKTGDEELHHHIQHEWDTKSRFINASPILNRLEREKLEAELNEAISEEEREDIQDALDALHNVARPAEEEQSIAQTQQDIDHAWEAVYHWHDTVLEHSKVDQIPEKDLYGPALKRLGTSGDTQAIAKVLSNPRTYEILFPEFRKDMKQKEAARKLKLTEVDTQVFDEVRKAVAFTVAEVSSAETGDFVDHEAEARKHQYSLEQMAGLSFAALISTLLWPYFAMGIAPAVILDVINKRMPLRGLYEGLASNGLYPELPDDLDESAVQAIIVKRVLCLEAVAVAAPLLGAYLSYLSTH